jgi:type I restriction enzyme S subunit
MLWSTVQADQFCTLITDGTHDSPKPQQSGWKLITSKHLKGHYIDFDSANWIGEADYLKVISRSAVEQWDILFSMIGTIGNIYLEKNPHVEYACKNMGIFKFSGNKENALWMYYYLKSPQAKAYIQTHLRGSTQSYVPLGSLRDMPVPVPPQSVRNEIIAILSPIDEKIECNNAINDNLEQQAQSCFQELFVDNADPEWATGTISDLGTVVGGSTPSKAKPEYYTESGIAWITPKDLSINKSKFISHGENDITELGLKNSSAAIMPEGTVLFSSRAPIGYIAIAAGEVTTNQGFKSVVPKPEIGTPFVYFFLKNTLPVIEGMASGSTFKEVSGSTMKNVPAVIPDAETLAKFSNFCAPIFAQQRILEEQNQSLAALRDNLLPRLMSGEIDVSAVQL